MSYGYKHASQPLSDMTFVHTYTRNSKTTGRIYANIVHIQSLLYYWKHLFSVLELDTRYDLGVMPPNTHRSSF